MSIQDRPHYELSPAELAEWVEQQGAEHCWSIEDELGLSIELRYPITGANLAAALRKRQRLLLLADKDGDPGARGQVVTAKDLDRLVDTWAHFLGERPEFSSERLLHLCWKGKDRDWTLKENFEETEYHARDLREQREWEEEQARLARARQETT